MEIVPIFLIGFSVCWYALQAEQLFTSKSAKRSVRRARRYPHPARTSPRVDVTFNRFMQKLDEFTHKFIQFLHKFIGIVHQRNCKKHQTSVFFLWNYSFV